MHMLDHFSLSRFQTSKIYLILESSLGLRKYIAYETSSSVKYVFEHNVYRHCLCYIYLFDLYILAIECHFLSIC